MRLYRGLRNPYDPKRVRNDGLSGTDFTDCPSMALAYAKGSRGVVLVLDVPAGEEMRVSEELWIGPQVKRYMVWGEFDSWLTAVVPAKDLRTALRQRGLRSAEDKHKSAVLERIIGTGVDGAPAAGG